MYYGQVILNPLNKVIFERSFDDLVEKVRGQEFVDVCSRELHRERLRGHCNQEPRQNLGFMMSYLKARNKAVIVPQRVWVLVFKQGGGLLSSPKTSVGVIKVGRASITPK